MAMVQISFNVSKLGHSIPSINLPPIVTCRTDAPCAKCTGDGRNCYALRGHWLYPAVKNRLAENLQAYKENPKLFFDMIAELTKLNRLVRWFSSGDIVDMDFLVGMCRVARRNKGTKYLCFTKKFELVNDYVASGKKIPQNLKIVFSTWGDFIPENPYNFPMSYVMFSEKDKNKEKREENKMMNKNIPEDAIPCGGDCASCASCWSLKKGQSVYFKKH